jgi:Tol biopolymer transport system component
MTGHDDFERTLARWFEADALSPAPAGALDRAIDATRRRRPRAAWLAGPASRWVGETQPAGSSSGARTLARSGLRWSTALILLMATLALLGGVVAVGARLTEHSVPTGGLGRLAYELDGDIYLADPDGRDPIRIADGQPGDGPAECGVLQGPTWSPDGRYLAYRSAWGKGCAPTVYISDAQGNAVASWAAGVGWDAAWAPDARRLVAWGAADGTIEIRGVDGVLQAELHLPEGFCVCGDYDPFWAHDGTAILLKMAQEAPHTQYWRLPIAGGSPSPLLDGVDATPICCLAYSSDGAKAAFWSGRADTVNENLAESRFVVTSAQDMTSALWSVKARGIGGPTWSPAGDRIAVTIVRDGASTGDEGGPVGVRIEDLQLLDVTRGEVTTLATVPQPGGISPLAFSPDGDRILFSRSDATDRHSLWSIGTDGSDARLLVTGTATGDWQPSPVRP